jgi:hypothetical protein
MEMKKLSRNFVFNKDKFGITKFNNLSHRRDFVGGGAISSFFS